MGHRATVRQLRDLSSERHALASGVEKARVYLALGRVSNLPTVWTNVITGVILAGGALEINVLLPLCIALSLFYTGGMFLNDAFDRRIDAKHRPDRLFPQERPTQRRSFRSGMGCWEPLY